MAMSLQGKTGSHITVPHHDSLKIGTLASILSDIASHFKITKQELFKELFG